MSRNELEFDWGNLPPVPTAKKKSAKEEKNNPAKIDVTVITLSNCRCKRKHKAPETFIKCALNKYNYNIPGKAALPHIDVTGSGVWATVHESMSEVYSSYSYDTETEYIHQYQILKVTLFDTLEDAAEWKKFQRKFCKSETGCSFSCNGVGMWNYVSKIVL